MLLPDITHVIDDPEVGGGVRFTVVRQSRKRTLVAGASEKTVNEKLIATGNIQPAQTSDLQLFPEEQRNTKIIVIRSTFTFQLGDDNGSGYNPTDYVIYQGEVYKVTRIDMWQSWGFQTAYATLQKGVKPDDYE